MNVQVTEMAGEPVLLPVWIMAYRFRDRLFRFLVNGQTGKATGHAPISYAKICGAILVAMLAILIVLLLTGVLKAAPLAMLVGGVAGVATLEASSGSVCGVGHGGFRGSETGRGKWNGFHSTRSGD